MSQIGDTHLNESNLNSRNSIQEPIDNEQNDLAPKRIGQAKIYEELETFLTYQLAVDRMTKSVNDQIFKYRYKGSGR